MGYLNNTTITVDAILTNKGRELLAKGVENFQITQFALGDDEIDYRLWNPNHTHGSNYYGELIEATPIMEATPNETQIMKSKLISIPARNITAMPYINNLGGNTGTVISLQETVTTATQTPTTANFYTTNEPNGYTVTISNSSKVSIIVPAGNEMNSGTQSSYVGDAINKSQTVVCTGFQLLGLQQNILPRVAVTLTIVGNDTGARKVYSVTVSAAPQQSTTIANTTTSSN